MKQAGRLSMASLALVEKLATWELAKTGGGVLSCFSQSSKTKQMIHTAACKQ